MASLSFDTLKATKVLKETDLNQRSRAFSAPVNGGASVTVAAVGIDVEVPAVSNTDGNGHGE